MSVPAALRSWQSYAVRYNLEEVVTGHNTLRTDIDSREAGSFVRRRDLVATKLGALGLAALTTLGLGGCKVDTSTTPSPLNLRVKMLQLIPGIFRGEAPVNRSALFVSLYCPGGDLIP